MKSEEHNTGRSAPPPIRVLIAKPGLDGHDVGAKLICRALIDAGMEVIYTGLRRSPAEIATAAIEEDVDAVGLSILSGAHLTLSRRVIDAMQERGADTVPVIVGGNIPKRDFDAMHNIGVARVFPTSSAFDDVVDYMRAEVTK